MTLGIAFLVWSLSVRPSFAASQGSLEPLTVELLAERRAALQTVSGMPTLALDHLRIDLTDAGEMRDRFYSELRAE
ncbi:MAG: hypothetical protein HC838_05165, partial [Spirulinaceae cyanobacterium RM2_2_10]|nr:hypothetical protein [Spirulinaceae cyanobacterium RM2_2_10]